VLSTVKEGTAVPLPLAEELPPLRATRLRRSVSGKHQKKEAP
jgi:hypothetical protein